MNQLRKKTIHIDPEENRRSMGPAAWAVFTAIFVCLTLGVIALANIPGGW